MIIDSFDTYNPVGILGSLVFVIMAIFAFTGLILTLYIFHKLTPCSLYKAIFKKILKTFLILLRSPAFYLLSFMVVSTAIWFGLNSDEKIASRNKESTPTPAPAATLVQPWQLNSRFKINAVVKFIKIDLDKDGKPELAAITSYDKMPNEVFYYAGFYRHNPATEMWDEFYGEELNILNYALIKEKYPEDAANNTRKIIDMWSTEFTTLENIGDVTGDGFPEIVFSSLLQGKNFDNYILVAQAGESHFRFRIFGDQNTMAKIVAEDGLMIEKYSDGDVGIKDIYEWDAKALRFKLLESQKTKNHRS
jgi:hypothetical protein